jgi:CheY-like chemotaxis protein
MLTRMQMAQWGIAPKLAADWDHAAELLARHRFDVLLLDVDMRMRPGSTAASNVLALERAMADRCRVPIVAYGQSDRGRPPRSLKRLGVDAAVRKPCSDVEMLACLFRSCGRSFARRGQTGVLSRWFPIRTA